MSRINQVYELARHFGLSWLIFRLGYAARRKTGFLRLRLPPYHWSDRPLKTWLKSGVPSTPEAYVAWRASHGGQFFFAALPAWPGNSRVAQAAESILTGYWRYFQSTDYPVGFPPDWHLNVAEDVRFPTDKHWSQIDEFATGDIKFVWEPNRFAVVFELVRAYGSTRDERYPSAFWQLVENWALENPPQLGPNWMCGQEAAIRTMAWCFGLYAFSQSPQSTPDRVAHLALLIASHGDRIAANIAYAMSTKSNHGISEAVGLWTIGLLFPEFAQADEWREKGQRLLEMEIRRQIYADGSYVMPSANYYRMSLQACLWGIRLGELNGRYLASDVCALVSKGIDFLFQLLDPETGQLPNFGSNDSALLLPLNECDSSDFRPILQLGYYTFHHELLFKSGPWNEDLVWLFGLQALDVPLASRNKVALDDFSGSRGGYYTLRGGESWAMIHCAHFTDRPSQVDQLHFDLWWRGINIVCDPGTYLYNGAPPWHNGLVSANVHNTIQVDNKEQMAQVGRFTWVNWAQGRVRSQVKSKSHHLAYWEGEHLGYQRLAYPVLHRRSITRLGSEHWLVVDCLQSVGQHVYRLHWLMPDLPYQWDQSLKTIQLDTPRGDYQIRTWCSSPEVDYSLVRASEHTTRGWYSRHYGEKQPALSLAAEGAGSTVWFWTLFGSDTEIEQDGWSSLQVTAPEWVAKVHLDMTNPIGRLVSAITLTGAIEDVLETVS